MVCGAW
ncbi:Protein of unknown function [Gryllus bimaculatus]|nr:Protein of unknown function [Gryllus bimaculatus]